MIPRTPRFGKGGARAPRIRKRNYDAGSFDERGLPYRAFLR